MTVIEYHKAVIDYTVAKYRNMVAEYRNVEAKYRRGTGILVAVSGYIFCGD